MLEIGKLIPEEMSEMFKRLISTKQLAEVANDHRLSLPTLKNLVYRTTSVTEDNYSMIDGLIKKALANIEAETTYLEKSKPKLEVALNAYAVLDRSVKKIEEPIN